MTETSTSPRPTELDRGLLTPEQVEEFDRNGFLILRQRIDAGLLARLRAASERWMADGQAQAPRSGTDWLFADRPSGPSMWRVDYIHSKGEPASLELLGSRAVLGIAESLAGPDFVPTYESMVLKAAGDGAPVPWHQDAVHHAAAPAVQRRRLPRRRRAAGAGALHVTPRLAEASARTRARSPRRYGWALPGADRGRARGGRRAGARRHGRARLASGLGQRAAAHDLPRVPRLRSRSSRTGPGRRSGWTRGCG
jgi:hypothetical protein